MIDDMVGLIVDKLKAEGLYDDTIIIYSADHGDCLGAISSSKKARLPLTRSTTFPWW